MTSPSCTPEVCALSSLDTIVPWFLKLTERERESGLPNPHSPFPEATSVPANRPQDTEAWRPAEAPSQHRARTGLTRPGGATGGAGSLQAAFPISLLVPLPLCRETPTPGRPWRPPILEEQAGPPVPQVGPGRHARWGTEPRRALPPTWRPHSPTGRMFVLRKGRLHSRSGPGSSGEGTIVEGPRALGTGAAGER